MDNSKTLTHLEWCAGYGGIHLGLRRIITDLRLIAFSEIEAYADANLVAKMENPESHVATAPCWTDLKTFPCEQFHGLVDIFSAGFPCQPFSCAGKGEADRDPRHLFPWIKRGIEIMRPAVVLLENVSGIISTRLRGNGWGDPAGTPVLLHVARELERIDFLVAIGVFSASEIRAPHQRKRVYILGLDKRLGFGRERDPGTGRKTKRRSKHAGGLILGDARGERRSEIAGSEPAAQVSHEGRSPNGHNEPHGPEQGMAHHESAEWWADIEHDELSRGRFEATGGSGRAGHFLAEPESGARGLHLRQGRSRQSDPDLVGEREDMADPGSGGLGTRAELALRTRQLSSDGRSARMADAHELHGHRAGSDAGEIPLESAAGLRSGDMADAASGGQRMLWQPSRSQRFPDGYDEALADAGQRQLSESERKPKGRNGSGSAGAISELGDAHQSRLEGWRHGRSGCAHQWLSRPAVRHIPRFPPGPSETTRWARLRDDTAAGADFLFYKSSLETVDQSVAAIQGAIGVTPRFNPPALQSSLEPALCGMAHGLAHRVDRLRLCGNGVLPGTVERAFPILLAELIG